MAEMTGTPITRGGGHFIRVGWRAKGYSVDSATAGKYRTYKILLFILAVAVGVGVSWGASFIFYTFVAPLAAKVTNLVKFYPQIWRFLIYGSTVFFGGIIYWHLRAKMGEALVKGKEAVDNGANLLAQRRRTAFVRKRERIPMVMAIFAVNFFAAEGQFALRMLATLIIAYFLIEGIYVQLTAKPQDK